MEKANNNRNRKKRRGRTINVSDETTNELRETDTDEEYIEIAIQEYRSVQPKQQGPVIVPVQKEAARNDDQLPNDENIADPRERLQRIRQQGYLAGGIGGGIPPKNSKFPPTLKKS